MYRLLIVDDEKMIVNSLVLGYDWKEQGFEVIGTASSGREALEMIARLHPDVVFTDIRMPGMTGLELMTAARKLPASPQFVVISGHAEFTYAKQAMQLGAAAYCLKPLEDEEIGDALDKVRQGLNDGEALRQAALLRFLAAPCRESSAALCPMAGACAVALASGRPGSLFAGAGCLSYSPSPEFSLHLLPGRGDELEDFGFRAAMLSAVSSGELNAWVYDVTDDPAAYLLERLPTLTDALYASWFEGRQPALGRVHPVQVKGENVFVARLAALCNKNRPEDALQCLTDITQGEADTLTMTDALRIHSLCASLLARLKDQPQTALPHYGWELAARYSSFGGELRTLRHQLGQAAGRVYDADTLHNETLQKIVTELNHSFAADVSFQEICARHSINPSYLSQLFKRELGVTFTAYVNTLRIGYAKELLERTSLLVSAIGDKVGYDNYLTFTKLFKRETGMTPKEYRAQSVNGHRESETGDK